MLSNDPSPLPLAEKSQELAADLFQRNKGVSSCSSQGVNHLATAPNTGLWIASSVRSSSEGTMQKLPSPFAGHGLVTSGYLHCSPLEMSLPFPTWACGCLQSTPLVIWAASPNLAKCMCMGGGGDGLFLQLCKREPSGMCPVYPVLNEKSDRSFNKKPNYPPSMSLSS